ncbi:hypothetical protein AVEN_165001-1 [Araneus ventricosus]|uniref:Uncharacterized protein n=1 Tax=Araneus ventricosus TaxID=182803 RepID=A0A4Y2UV29_ARAVE|nr:hypothetical protein AVEN_165001-1 [Araneus ventricosus]
MTDIHFRVPPHRKESDHMMPEAIEPGLGLDNVITFYLLFCPRIGNEWTSRSTLISLRPSAPTEPEGVLLIKPKSELLKDHDENRKTFLNILREKNPEIRLRSVGKIFGGGLKIVASTEEDVSFIRNVFPQLILYNVDKDVKLETLQTGLLAKNIFLADSMNKSHFKIEFSIPAKDRSKNHWVLSINPKKFEEIKEKQDYILNLLVSAFLDLF